MNVSGGCHCGAVRFGAEVPESPVPALHCNCSVCRMTGFLHVMVPHERFELVTGRHLLGRLKRFDRFAVVLESEGKEILIYKHAIATIALAPASPPAIR